jgi:uncharacterized surface protein with fasciclin (FAS1) repeats
LTFSYATPLERDNDANLEASMNRLYVLFALTAAVALAATPAAAHCGACGTDAAHEHATKANIVDTAANAGDFNTLVAAVKAAGLVDTLTAEGPYTVFAPTDAAFAKLPAGTVDNLLANPDQLRQILLYHVVPGKVTANEVVKLSKATTAEGSDVKIKVADGVVKVDGANVVATDIETSNGVIHVIDTVILPTS